MKKKEPGRTENKMQENLLTSDSKSQSKTNLSNLKTQNKTNSKSDFPQEKKVTILDPKEMKVDKGVPSTSTNISTSAVKKAKDDLKKDELLFKIKEYEEKLKLEKEEKKKLLDQKNKELENKEKIIVSIAGTNKKLVTELEDLKKEVDAKLDKIGIKQIQDKEKELDAKNKIQPLEQVIRVKEKELKNAVNLIEILKKDKAKLEEIIEEKSDYGQVVSLQDKLKLVDRKIAELETEVKTLNKVKEEHFKCEKEAKKVEKELDTLRRDLGYLKERNKQLTKRLKEEESRLSNMNMSQGHSNNIIVINNNSTSNATLPKIKLNKENQKSRERERETHSVSLERYWKELEHADKEKKTKNNIWSKSKSRGKLNEKKLRSQLNQDRKNYSRSLQNKNFRSNSQESPGHSQTSIVLPPIVDHQQSKLFGEEERNILTKLLPPKELEKIEEKYNTVDQSKASIERKFAIESKSLNKKLHDLEERLEYSHLHIKEQEQRNKILSFQINEQKNEIKILTRKLAEVGNDLTANTKKLKEKEEENKKLVMHLQDLQKKFESGELLRMKDEVDEVSVQDGNRTGRNSMTDNTEINNYDD